ncbi:MAG: ATP-binding cassette domain-containing protein [Oscillospiraceae bacterium]|nr:ATP-binding cassette domain-containing protein [Oscillospiraceae bacterium]
MSDSQNSAIVLEMRDISKRFPGVQALNNAQLTLKRGEVHALLGENGAGKSTLMKCLFGIYSRDSGDIIYKGKSVNFSGPKEALDNGISMVHQELNQVPARNVMENIWLGRFPGKLMVDGKKMYNDTVTIFKDLNIDVNPKSRLDDLSVSQRQMIEIAKAVSYDAKVIVFDESTSSLTEREVKRFFSIIRALKEKGISMIYITHKMNEVKEIADEVTIMRDGCHVFSGPASDITIDEIISKMVGRELSNLYPPKTNTPSEKVLLKVENLTGTYQPTIKDVSFELHEGEILGVAGLMGSRRTELVETIFGLRKLESGKIYLDDKEITNKNSVNAIKNGFALLTEERRATGIFSDLSIQFNAVVSHIDIYCNALGVLNDKSMKSDTQGIIDVLKVKTPSQRTNIGSLSGGNQQKVIFGRWMLNDFRVLMLDEPTRGIDVGAKYEIYQLIIDIAKKGKGVIFVSSEMPELLGVADRILVMSNGHMAGVLDREHATQEEILKLSTKYL